MEEIKPKESEKDIKKVKSKKNNKPKKWIKFRHRVVVFIAWIFVGTYLYIHGYRWKKLKKRKDKKPYLIFYNHQTVYDQFLLAGMSIPKTYFVMSDDLSSIKYVSGLLNFLVHPIPYKKASTDFTILRNLKQVISEGGSVAISVEGNRTYSGKTEYINPTAIRMMKFLKVPVVIARIEGGYGKYPRWAEKERRGKTICYPYKIYEYEEYKDLPDDELYNIICKDLYIDESTPSGPYKSKKKAENLERVIYNCPHCGFTKFKTKDNILSCTTCDLELEYTEYKQFEWIDKTKTEKVPFANVNEWYEFQKEELLKMNLLEFDKSKVLFEDVCKFSEVQIRKKKNVLFESANVKLYCDRFEISYDNKVDVIKLDDISSSGVFGKNKFNIYVNKNIYQFKSDVSFNAMKYVNIIYKYKIEKGDEKDGFLGL